MGSSRSISLSTGGIPATADCTGPFPFSPAWGACNAHTPLWYTTGMKNKVTWLRACGKSARSQCICNAARTTGDCSPVPLRVNIVPGAVNRDTHTPPHSISQGKRFTLAALVDSMAQSRNGQEKQLEEYRQAADSITRFVGDCNSCLIFLSADDTPPLLLRPRATAISLGPWPLA